MMQVMLNEVNQQLLEQLLEQATTNAGTVTTKMYLLTQNEALAFGLGSMFLGILMGVAAPYVAARWIGPFVVNALRKGEQSDKE
jgi:hypothetical protein